jgi:hydroxymethylglutaryl-CoA lyase
MTGSGSPDVTIVEVGPRDGLQNEARSLPPEVRAELVHRLQDAGARRIEVASFVNPARVPQMAGAEELVAQLERREGVSYSALVMNERGFDRAAGVDLQEINFAFAATDVFNGMNTGMTVEESLRVFDRIAGRGRDAGLMVTCTIGVAFGCHFAGEVPVESVVRMAESAVAAGADEVAVADTIGVAVPTQVRQLLSALQKRLPGTPLRIHLHNTRNTGFVNAVAAIEAGVTTLDASVGGIGGCPFAPDAAGNIGTEDLVFLLERMGLRTGLDLEATMANARWIEGHLGHQVTALLSRAGVFPRPTTDAPST